jgi:hypothetical protein
MMNKNLEEAIALYKSGAKLEEIKDRTGVFASTMYANMRRMGLRKRTKNILKKNISIDEDVQKIIEKENPDNLSAWICEKIKAATKGCNKR